MKERKRERERKRESACACACAFACACACACVCVCVCGEIKGHSCVVGYRAHGAFARLYVYMNARIRMNVHMCE